MRTIPARSQTTVLMRLALVCCQLLLAAGATGATLLVANKSDDSLSLLQLPGGELVATLPTGKAPHEVAVSPDGRRALVSNYGTQGRSGRSLTLVDIPAARVVGTIELVAGARPHGVRWVDNQRAVVTAEGLRALLLVDSHAMAVTQVIEVGQDIAHMVAYAREPGLAFTANIGSGSATVIDLARGRKLADLAAGAGTEGIALVRGGAELWVSNREENSITVFSVSDLQPLARIPAAGFPIRLEADDARGRVYVSLPAADSLAVIDSATRQQVRTLEFDIEPDRERRTLFGDMLPDSSIPIGVLLSGDGESLFVAHSNAHVVSVYDAQELELKNLLATGLEPDGLGWSVLDVHPGEY